MTEHLHSRLKAVWWRGQMLHASAGLLAFCRWGIPLFLAGMAIDWLVDLPAWGRAVILVTVLGVAAYKAWRCGWRLAGAFNATHTALRVEERVGGLASLLVTAVQLPDTGVSESLRDATLRRAEETAAGLHAKKIVGFQELRRPALVAAIMAVIIGVFAMVGGSLLIAGMARFFAPWLSVQYPTRTQLELTNGNLVVKEGDRAQIGARVSGVIPRRAKLALRTGTGTSRKHELAITNRACSYTIESVFRGFEYRIQAGDARSPWQTVQVIPPPRIERAEVRLEFPAYTERPTETGEALTVVVPENTGIQWRLTLDRAVSKAEFMTAGEAALPLKVSADGRVVTMRRVATESRAYNFAWVEREHGFAFTSPRYYVQVSPDQRPNVELTAPRADLYATLGRKLDLAFRGRDDFGIGESVIAYRVNKTGEVKVPFAVPALHDGSEQRIDWDYRTVLTNLVVGDNVLFAVELADRYPGPTGPHRVRSDLRRITFLSKEDYLEQIAKQKQRLLSQLQNIYREERVVHDLVRRLDPLDDVFIQTCQLEAVRQDLLRERLGLLATGMRDLIEDLAANNITEEKHSAGLGRLAAAIQAIAVEHVGGAASNLRSLASVAGKGVADPAPAVLKVNTAARELGLLVLELGYRDAAEVMARELHATAQTQASLRLKTILPGKAASDATGAVAVAQEQLIQSLTRLLAATPREQESTMKDALIAFGLTRLAKQLHSTGVETKMREAAGLIRSGGSADAARRQAEVIQALLRAEFRLRYGAEYEALSKAREILIGQADGQKALRVESATLTAEEAKRRHAALKRNLQWLLLPAIPAPRAKLFDVVPPPAPPVNDLLAAAERAAAGNAHQQAEESFTALAEIVRKRIATLTEVERLTSFLDICGTGAIKLDQFRERQLSLLEKTGVAAGDRAESAYLADPQQKLLADITAFRTDVIEKTVELGIGRDAVLPVQTGFDQAVRAMADAAATLRTNQPAKAGVHQNAAVAALKEIASLLADNAKGMAALVKVSGDAANVLLPGPYVADIVAEQRDLIAATRKAQPADFPGLVMPQKNLVHAVNAVLAALDFLAHKVETGTGMLFAKTDMDSAAVALASKDANEAIDAQTAVADSVHDLQAKLQAVTPQYGYILEITEFVHDLLPAAASLRAAQGELLGKALAGTDDASVRKLTGEQRSLSARATTFGSLLSKATGQERFLVAAKYMAEAASRLEAGDKTAAVPLMQQAEDALVADTAELLTLMNHLAIVLSPPPPGSAPSPEVKLLLDALPVAAQQKELWFQAQTDVTKQRALEKQCAAFIPLSQSHPKLVAAKLQMTTAATKLEAGARAEAVTSQQQAEELLRHFIIEYIVKYVQVPGPLSPQPPAPSDDPGDEQDITIFMPGAVSGKLPKTGRVEWEVLGRRERAALNENFARELPLEYRAILKDYYERLTR